VSTCPTPEKIKYRSERAAKKALRSIINTGRDGGEHIHVYRCGGHWHCGHGHKSWHTKPGRKFR